MHNGEKSEVKVMENISKENRKARKEHRCDFCLRVIGVGEQYEHQTNVDGGVIYYWKSHLGCLELYDELDMGSNDWGDGISSDDFMERVAEFLYYNLSEEEFDEVIMNDKEVETALRLLKGVIGNE